MIYEKERDLNLLPINLQMFLPVVGFIDTVYETNVSGTYGQGLFPTSRYVEVSLTCSGGICRLSGVEEDQ